jgi:hypothetical protein
MREIFQRRTFWVILVILLLAVFIYPPWIKTTKFKASDGTVSDFSVWRDWDWLFSNTRWGWNWPEPRPTYIESIELDLKMMLAESIIAILLTIGVCLIPFSRGSYEEKKNQ